MEKLRTFIPKSLGKYFPKHCVLLNRISFLASVHFKHSFYHPLYASLFSHEKYINFHKFSVCLFA